MGCHASLPGFLWLEARPELGGSDGYGLPSLFEVWQQALPCGGVSLFEGDRDERGDGEDREFILKRIEV